MSTAGAQAGLDTFDALNIDYEHAYADNPYKIACINHAITLLPPKSQVLDVGCGSGIPVAKALAAAGHHVTGFDISPKMVAYASSRVAGDFTVDDMLTYQPLNDTFAAIFVIFSQLQLQYADFRTAMLKYAAALRPGGLLVLGQMPGDDHVKNGGDWDETRTWVEDYPAPFMGEMLPTLMLSREGQRKFLQAIGLQVAWERIDVFEPKNERCVPEEQQYIIARKGEGRVEEPSEA